MRFADTPFSNPFASSARVETSSAQGGNQAPAQQAPMQTASVQSQSLPPIQSQASRSGSGTQITVSPNDSLTMISQRYGVPASQILAANGMQNANQITPGTRLTIPAHGAAVQTQVASAPVRAVVQPRIRSCRPDEVPSRRFLQEQGRGRGRGSAEARPSRDGLEPAGQGRIGDVGARDVGACACARAPQKVASLPEAKPIKPAPVAPVVEPAPVAAPAAKAPVADPEQTASVSNDNFR